MTIGPLTITVTLQRGPSWLLKGSILALCWLVGVTASVLAEAAVTGLWGQLWH